MKKYDQQGDTLRFPVESIPAEAKKLEGRNFIAEGEVTGHAHRITEGDFELYEHEGTLYLKAKTKCKLTHEEHKAQVIAPGQYKIGIVREFDYEEMAARKVAD